MGHGPLRLFPGTWSTYRESWYGDRGPGTMPTFAIVQTAPYLGLNIKYGIYPLYGGVA